MGRPRRKGNGGAIEGSSRGGDAVAAADVGIIGGSGLYEIDGLTDIEVHRADTPYGDASGEIVIGTLNGVRAAFLPRHGPGHRISPSELPARANIWALKTLGVRQIISISAVGSLREQMAPRHVVIPDQLIDRTRGLRPSTFFGDGIVAHVAFAEPYCPALRAVVTQAAREVLGDGVHEGGTLVVMEGPQFSTRAESLLHRQWGADLIGMTALPEAKLAREAEICYCTLAMVTDYDSWHESEEPVTVEMVISNLLANVAHARAIVATALPRISSAEGQCDCHAALGTALITQREAMPAERIQALWPLLGKYLS
jgi:5'-methylthioadenosine phosphorylase